MIFRTDRAAAGRVPGGPQGRTGHPGKGAGRRAGHRRRQFVPPQHGAWAMLVVPYLAGLLVAGATWVDLPLLGAWLSGYLLSYYVFQSVKSRRLRRYRDQLILYGALTLPLVTVVVVARPAVLWYAPAYAVLLGVNAWYAWRRRERALSNDLGAVLQSCLMVLVAGTVAGVGPAATAGAFLVCTGYFVGTVFYVKTMIRERGKPAWLRWSVCYHLAALVLSAGRSAVLAGLFGWLLVRAWALPRRRLTPLKVGLIEMVNCVLLLAAVALVWG